ncbi:MAG: MBOAT family protein [Oscillospiraceae bacterium]|nr:MBOAT family protein [Oscillospiraceae bacterium]
MLFSGIPFLYYFLPCTLALYFLAPKGLKNTVLLAMSLLFYAWGEPRYVLLMAAVIAVGYVFGLLIGRTRGTKAAKLFLTAAVTTFLAILGWFKYSGFFAENFEALTGVALAIPKVALPIGISFYTFQIMSYTVDVYRGDTAAQKNPVTLAAYTAMFPQLIAGPIVRYVDVKKQLEHRTHSVAMASAGVRRFTLGLAKKILIANALGELCDIFRASDDKSVLFYWLYAVAFMLHIYFDFSGYSDMAIGLGKIFGMDFMENFNYPYISRSVTEFWRRWHMSLGSWFRDYVYIPLGGNRRGTARQLFNIFVVWMLTGLWHGAAWNFVVWGLFFAVLLVVEKLFLLPYLKCARVLSHIYVLFAVLVSFVIFNAADMTQAMGDIGGLFGAGSIALSSTEAVYELRNYGFILLIAIIGATPLPKMAATRLQETEGGAKVLAVAEPVVLVALLLVMTAYLVDGSFNPFLYFRF